MRLGLEMSDFHEITLCTFVPPRETQTWPAVTCAELQKEAGNQTGTAASIDGWSGDEVASVV